MNLEKTLRNTIKEKEDLHQFLYESTSGKIGTIKGMGQQITGPIVNRNISKINRDISRIRKEIEKAQRKILRDKKESDEIKNLLKKTDAQSLFITGHMNSKLFENATTQTKELIKKISLAKVTDIYMNYIKRDYCNLKRKDKNIARVNYLNLWLNEKSYIENHYFK